MTKAEKYGVMYLTQNQRLILERYAKEHCFLDPRFFVDDGISGVSFGRVGAQLTIEMLKEL